MSQLLAFCCCDGEIPPPDECADLLGCDSSVLINHESTGTTVLDLPQSGILSISWELQVVAIGERTSLNRYSVNSSGTGEVVSLNCIVTSESAGGASYSGNGQFDDNAFGQRELIYQCTDVDIPPSLPIAVAGAFSGSISGNQNTFSSMRFIAPHPPQLCPAPATMVEQFPAVVASGLRTGSVFEISAVIDSFSYVVT